MLVTTSNRKNWLVLVGAFWLVVAIAVAGISYSVAERQRFEREAEAQQSRYVLQTFYPFWWACLKKGEKAPADCLALANNGARDNERAEQDLLAQRVSALWAFVMAIVAIVGVLLSAVGAVLVWITFSATREGNRIAKDIGEAQVSASLHLKEATFSRDREKFKVRLRIENLGSSVAPMVSVRMLCNFVFSVGQRDRRRPAGHVRSEMIQRSCQPVVAGQENLEDIQFFWPGSFEVPRENNSLEESLYQGSQNVTVELELIWRDIFDRVHRMKSTLDGSLNSGNVENQGHLVITLDHHL